MKERIITNGRVAIEKGMLPDEAVCVGQLSGGDGIYVSQSDGQLINSAGEIVFSKDGKNNMVISQQRVHLNVRFVNANRLEGLINYWTINKMFGALLNTSLLIINSISYNMTWFNVVSGTDQYGNSDMPVITWSGAFPLEVTDSIYWSI